MPNQNECDHYIAINHEGGEWAFKSDNLLELEDVLCNSSPFEKFKYCPDCGAKIDWEAIKEACDENK